LNKVVFSRPLQLWRAITGSKNVLLRQPSRSDVVIFDLQDDIMALLEDVPAEVFDPRYETIYLPTLIRGTFRWIRGGLAFTLTHHYFLSFLASTRPKIVLTIIDNNRDLYTASMASADWDARFVIFQNGNRFLSELPSKKSLLPGDIFF
jgi:surface carbohydrate biosynthesis protein